MTDMRFGFVCIQCLFPVVELNKQLCDFLLVYDPGLIRPAVNAISSEDGASLDPKMAPPTEEQVCLKHPAVHLGGSYAYILWLSHAGELSSTDSVSRAW